jgi:hypothetical protein
MGRKPIDPKEKKHTITISLKKKHIDQLKKHGSISAIIQKLVEQFIKDKG